jgi:hypothetical protein
METRLFEATRTALEMVRGELESVEVSTLAGPDAAEMLSVFGNLVKLGQAGLTLAAGRVEATNKSSLAGTFRDAKDAIAAAAGVSRGQADSLLDLASRLDQHQKTKEAFKDGLLSVAEATEVAKAADRNRAAEEALLNLAAENNFTKLRNAAAAVQSPDPDDDARRAAYARAKRDVKTWVDSEGLAHLRASGPADLIARMWAKITAASDTRFRSARAEGRRDLSGHYRFDGLADLFGAVESSGVTGRTKTDLLIMVNFDSLIRGFTVPGERCEIPGMGPVSVEAARSYVGEAALKFLVSDGVDIRSVAHLGRHVGSHLRTALAWKFSSCIDCGAGLGLELDHLEPYAKGGPTSLENLAPRCKACHREKTARDFPEGTSGFRRRQEAIAGPGRRSRRGPTAGRSRSASVKTVRRT